MESHGKNAPTILPCIDFISARIFLLGRHHLTFKEIRGKPHFRWTICGSCRLEKLQIYLGEVDRISFNQIDFVAVLKNSEFSHQSEIELQTLLDLN